MRALLVICILALATPAILARTMDRCSLAREMDNLGVPRNQLARWACIAQHESSYRTGVVGPPNSDGSNDYGIFQINDLYWCQPSSGKFSHNACNIRCDDLLTDDISRSVKCARMVQREQGWSAWSVWPRCSGQLPSIDDCFTSGKSLTDRHFSNQFGGDSFCKF
nr:lysozyme X-like [Drosophila takahashii]